MHIIMYTHAAVPNAARGGCRGGGGRAAPDLFLYHNLLLYKHGGGNGPTLKPEPRISRFNRGKKNGKNSKDNS